MDAGQVVTEPFRKVEHVVHRLWGSNRGGISRTNNGAREAHRVEAFKNALVLTSSACERVAEVPLPHLTKALVDEALALIAESLCGLKKLQSRLLEEWNR